MLRDRGCKAASGKWWQLVPSQCALSYRSVCEDAGRPNADVDREGATSACRRTAVRRWEGLKAALERAGAEDAVQRRAPPGARAGPQLALRAGDAGRAGPHPALPPHHHPGAPSPLLAVAVLGPSQPCMLEALDALKGILHSRNPYGVLKPGHATVPGQSVTTCLTAGAAVSVGLLG